MTLWLKAKAPLKQMGNDSLKVIAHELLVEPQGQCFSGLVTPRKALAGRMRVLVKRILRKHGYPPALQDAAVQAVLRQAEALSANWAA